MADERMTQRQIAEELGVSRQLVSFALQGKGRMSDEKRQKILRFARENNYHEFSNNEARQMISRRYGKRAQTGIIAAVFNARFEGQPITSLPFFAPFFEGLENESIERNLDLVLCPLRAEGLPLLVREQRVDGVICLFIPECDAARLGAPAMPTVSLPYQTQGAPCISIEDAQGTRLTTQHLIGLGHQRIAYLGMSPTENEIGAHRLQGYQSALADAGLPQEARWINSTLEDPTKGAGREAANALLKTRQAGQPNFSAIVCYNDEIAMGTVEALQAAGVNVPDEISVTGFDDISIQSNFALALTSVAIPRQAMARRAVELLCQQNQARRDASNDDFSSYLQQFPVKLVTRDSSAPPPTSSP